MRAMQDLDGRHLNFLNDNRPACRFLYFRYLMTYLAQKKAKNFSWASNIYGDGNIWATPGPYLRKSMLQVLARSICDHELPKALIENNTFKESSDSPGPGREEAEETEVCGISLAVRMKDEENK